MIKIGAKIIWMLLAAIELSACSSAENVNGPGRKAIVGALAGAGVGAYGGSQIGRGSGKTLMTILGSVLGGAAGYYIGDQLDTADRQKAEQARLQALAAPIGSEIRWANRDAASGGGALTTKQGRDVITSQTCRELIEMIFVEGWKYMDTVVFCQNPDGSWSSR